MTRPDYTTEELAELRGAALLDELRRCEISAYSDPRANAALFGASVAELDALLDELRRERAHTAMWRACYEGVVDALGLRKAAPVTEARARAATLASFVDSPSLGEGEDVSVVLSSRRGPTVFCSLARLSGHLIGRGRSHDVERALAAIIARAGRELAALILTNSQRPPEDRLAMIPRIEEGT